MYLEAGDYAKGVFNQGFDIASTTFDGAKKTVGSIYESVSGGIDKLDKLERPEMPEWMQNIIKFGGKEDGERGSGAGGEGGAGGGRKKPDGGKNPYVAAGAVTAGAYVYTPEEDARNAVQAAKDDQMMLLTKKMIEIRNILSRVGQTQAQTLQLPSIVVIGSQSSGKSSVLEAIVGQT